MSNNPLFQPDPLNSLVDEDICIEPLCDNPAFLNGDKCKECSSTPFGEVSPTKPLLGNDPNSIRELTRKVERIERKLDTIIDRLDRGEY